MAIQSPNPAAPSDQSSTQTPAQGPELSKTLEGNGQVADDEVVNDTSDRPFLAPSVPMREDQVENAVKFLSHPKVRGSPVIYRRSFLEKKGLTKEEIDEAFHRVPDPPSNVTTVEAVTTNQVAQLKPSTSLQPQGPIHPQQSAGVPVNSAIVPNVQHPKFQWSRALIGTGVLAASGAGTAVFFTSMVVPRLKSWIRKVVAAENESEKEDKPHSVLADQTSEAAKAAATAAAVVAKASEDLLHSKNEERTYLDAFMSKLDVQMKEMKSMGEAIRKLESTRESNHSQDRMLEEYIRSNVGNGTTNNSWETHQVDQSNTSISHVPKQVKANGTTNHDYSALRPSSAPATVEPTTAPHPKSYMEIMAMIQRGERPPNIREINDMPPNPNQQPSKPVLAPKPKPWEVHQQMTSSSFPHPPQPSEGSSSGHLQSGSSFDPNGRTPDSSEPWWKKKTVKITEEEPEADEQQQQPPSSYSVEGRTDRPIQRSWVPPQPPTVAIPEAAAAIRQPKSSGQTLQSDEVAGAADSDKPGIEGEASGNGIAEPSRSAIEEEQEPVVEISV